MTDRRFDAKKIIALMLPLVWMLLIFYFSAQTAEDSAELSGGIVADLIAFLNITLSEHFVRKAAHFSEYAMLGFLTANAVRLNFSGSYPRIAVLICAFYSVTDEFHQIFVPGRSCQLSDMLLDTAGSVFGILIIWLFLHLLGRRKVKKSL